MKFGTLLVFGKKGYSSFCFGVMCGNKESQFGDGLDYCEQIPNVVFSQREWTNVVDDNFLERNGWDLGGLVSNRSVLGLFGLLALDARFDLEGYSRS